MLLHSSSLRFVPFFFKRKTGPKKNCGGGTARRPALVWFSPGNRPPFRPPPEWGGPEVGLSFGLSFFDGGFAAVEGPAGGGPSMDVVLLFSLGGLVGPFGGVFVLRF